MPRQVGVQTAGSAPAAILTAGRDGCRSPCFLSVAAWLTAHGHCAAHVTAARRGVFKYSNGDRYEGEFQDNQMSGFGVYVWGQEGSVYRGQVRAGAGVGEGSRAACRCHHCCCRLRGTCCRCRCRCCVCCVLHLLPVLSSKGLCPAPAS